MIEYLNSQQLPCLVQALGNRSVFLTRQRVTAYMLVPAYKPSSISENRCLKRFTWMNDRSRQAADRDSMDTDHSIFLVKHQDDKVFSVCISKEFLQHRVCIG